MEPYEEAKLRMQCLELARHISAQACAGFDSVISDAEKLWGFVAGNSKTNAAPIKDDDISF